ncbi:CCA tRNA nucleotidyltransferase [Candidatus Bathyarchaeota archaeon]|nr:CCA tRNA nucleotidyltransferase [Candidatus Bathyarchaeota archaeon]
MNDMEYTQLREKVLERIKPGEADEKQIDEFTTVFVKEINALLREEGLDAEAELHGSVAHGTWIRGGQDLDVFIVLGSGYERDDLHRVLEALKRRLDGDYVEAYAEHPYLQARVDGYSVDLVPCFRLEKGGRIKSSTDRTPLHTGYLAERLTDEARDEVRLLKQFTDGIGVYGAEIRVKGFSGYLCELLVLRYGSFTGLLEAASTWRRGTVISLEGQGEPAEAFKDPLVVVDPVDTTRNVASALSPESLWTFVAAARDFLGEPEVGYFFPSAEASKEGVLSLMDGRGSDLVFLVVEEHRAEVPDSLWGQLHKSHEALRSALTVGGFKVLRSTVWSNEENRHVFVYELESASISGAVKHLGPPVAMTANSESFLARHAGNGSTVAGPWIEGDRWAVLSKRQFTEAGALLTDRLEDGGRGVGVSKNLAVRVLQHHRVLLNGEIGDYLGGGFTLHLHRFLKGRPRWFE